jgi:hypothetical protein
MKDKKRSDQNQSTGFPINPLVSRDGVDGPGNPGQSDDRLDFAIQTVTDWYIEAGKNYLDAECGSNDESEYYGEQNAYWQVRRLLDDIQAKSRHQANVTDGSDSSSSDRLR